MKNEVVYLSYSEAQDLVERIADRASHFDHDMQDNEKEAMAQLLSDTGVKVSDLIDVSNLADNYAINAEIVTGDEEAESYSRITLRDALFTWEDDSTGEKCYCIQW